MADRRDRFENELRWMKQREDNLYGRPNPYRSGDLTTRGSRVHGDRAHAIPTSGATKATRATRGTFRGLTQTMSHGEDMAPAMSVW